MNVANAFSTHKPIVALHIPKKGNGELRIHLYGPTHPPSCSDSRMVVHPQNQTGEGFLEIAPHQEGVETVADGVLLHSMGAAASMQMRDCFAVVFYNTTCDTCLLLHVGRPQLTPNTMDKYGPFGKTILSVATKLWFDQKGMSFGDTRAVIIRGICGKHFVHDDPRDIEVNKDLLRPFGEFYICHGRQWDIFSDANELGLNLENIIVETLLFYGLDRQQISAFGDCTHGNRQLASLRRDGKECLDRNTVVVELLR